MHVIILADFAVATGGAQRVAVMSARALAEAGVHVTFIHAISGADASLEHPAINRVCLDLSDIWTRGAASAAISGVWNREAARRLKATLASVPRDGETVAHVHQWTRAFSPSIFSALRESGLPTVVTAHDYFLACPNGVFYRFDRQAPCALAPMSGACALTNCDTRSYAHKLVRVARQAVTDRQWRDWRVDVIHIADLARERLAPVLPANWRHHRVDNPIAATRGEPASIASDSVFVMVGRLTVDKGAVLAAQAAARAGARMLFIGEGPASDAIRAVLPDAEITGWLPPEQVDRLVRTRARALLAPSLWPETGPMTPLEAAAIGVPAIVSARCGAAERVDGSSGRVAEPAVEAFARAIQELKDENVARALGRGAYEGFWRAPPTPDAHARALIDVYHGMFAD